MLCRGIFTGLAAVGRRVVARGKESRWIQMTLSLYMPRMDEQLPGASLNLFSLGSSHRLATLEFLHSITLIIIRAALGSPTAQKACKQC